MKFRALQHTHLLAAVVFLAAVLVLAVQLITPSPVMVSLGEAGAQTTSVGEYFTYREVTVVAISAFVAGVSGTYLVVHNQAHAPSHQDITRTRPKTNVGPETNGGAEIPAHQPTRPEPDPSMAKDRWEEKLERLSNNQEVVYELLLEANGELEQRKIVEETDLSKATVSRTLDKLEHRGLVERQRNGMGNTICLQ